jgi:hypothetical protein
VRFVVLSCLAAAAIVLAAPARADPPQDTAPVLSGVPANIRPVEGNT